MFVARDDRAEVIAERQNFLLFNRMVAFHVQRGVLGAARRRRVPRRTGNALPPSATCFAWKRCAPASAAPGSGQDYATIITVVQKIPDAVLQEDLKLLMWYDQALTRSGQNP